MSHPRRDTGAAPLPDGLSPQTPAPPAAHAAGAAGPVDAVDAAAAAERAALNQPPPGGASPHAVPPSPSGEGALPPPDLGWMGDLQGLAQAARGMFQSRALLLMLELERARHGLINLMVLLVVAAIAGATAWFALWAGAIALAVHLGLALPWACLGVLVINLLLLGWVASAMKSLAPLMSLPASRRQFHWLFNDPRDQEDTPADGRPAAPSA
ncbi:phage holin family protein [Roseateles terrae]|uniref:Phage holin family protein n=1 Tax=Roseateles terrae TaxID=431060 RepID=A0ABR6GKT7_9BURK|nr:phage holin family protein [Roseateles terrae]MBB3192720.1 hypothetical protein [Roseateles terrae]